MVGRFCFGFSSFPSPFFLVVRLLATVEGRPLPTELPKRPPPSSSGGGGKYGGGFGNGSGGGGGVDQRSMERLAGETDSEYVARQTALRGEASARMRDKFGGTNRMQGLGSDSSYNPASGGYGGGGGGGGGLNADEIGGQIGVLGQKSMRFLSDSFATLQTGVKVGNRHTGGRGVMQLSIHALMMRRNWERLLLERARGPAESLSLRDWLALLVVDQLPSLAQALSHVSFLRVHHPARAAFAVLRVLLGWCAGDCAYTRREADRPVFEVSLAGDRKENGRRARPRGIIQQYSIHTAVQQVLGEMGA